MAAVIDRQEGQIVGYDERRGLLLVEVPYTDYEALIRRQYKKVSVQLIDGRRLSDSQRRSCYAMIREVADWMGEMPAETKEFLKFEFITTELLETADAMFSLSDAPMSLVAAFQSFIARFIVRNDIPTKIPMLEYVDDVSDYVYACIINKKCAICGQKADLHHVDRLGMGADRDEVVHEGLKVLPLCRTHHTEAHTIGHKDFIERYHLCDGIPADKTICKIYKLKEKKT